MDEILIFFFFYVLVKNMMNLFYNDAYQFLNTLKFKRGLTLNLYQIAIYKVLLQHFIV